MQALGVAPAVEDAARELVDDLHLAVLHDVVHVLRVQLVGAQGLGEVVDVLEVLVGEEGVADQPAALQERLDVVHALVGEGDPLVLLLQLEVARGLRVPLGIRARGGVLLALHQLVDELVHLRELERVVLRHARR